MEFEINCIHEDVPESVLKVGFSQPTHTLERMLLLLRETFGRTRLSAPVHTIILQANSIKALELSNLDLFQDNSEVGDGNLLLERLRIRLGKEAVFSVATAADHRPELAWRPCDAGEAVKTISKIQRPLWLLPKPLPCQKDRLELKTGPERIESGWWDGMDALRDYYVAQGRNGSRLWVYRDRMSGAWFVHGLFA
jgi:protein ImuB